MKIRTAIPQHWVEKMTKADRKKFGVKTHSEIIATMEIKNERDLHRQIANLLRLRGIKFFSSRTDKRTTRPVGEPDFIFAVWITVKDKNDPAGVPLPISVPVAWELKMPGRNLDDEQLKTFVEMVKPPNAWGCHVIHSVDEALAELKRMGV